MYNSLNHTTHLSIQVTAYWRRAFTAGKRRLALLLFPTMFASFALNAQTIINWEVQSDYFGERNAVAQTRTIRSMALSKDGNAVYTGNIQSPNVGSNAIRKVSSTTLAVAATDHVIFGNGMPGGSGAFGPVGGQPVYAGGATGTFLGWTATGNSPRGLATDDRGYVYAALSSGISPANQVVIFSSDLSSVVGTITITGPTGVSVRKSGSTYYLYIAADTQLKRYDVTNAASPTLDAGWTNTITSGAMGLTVDADGTVFLAGGGQVRRISAAGAVTHTTTLANAADIAVFHDKIYVIRQGSPAQSVTVYNKVDLSSGGSDLVVPELGAFTRGSLSQFTAIDVSADGRLWVSEENYTGGSNGIPSYTPPVTTFNPAPGAITGRIYFDRVLVSSPVADPCDVAIGNVSVSHVTCPGANDGSIVITASTSTGPLTYSISGPVNQSNGTGVFPNLPDGSYDITVSDNGVVDCMTTSLALLIVQNSNNLPNGWSNANVGNANGSATFEPCVSDGQFTVSATGFSTPMSDVLHLASYQLCGNSEIIAHVASVSGSGWAGITLRETLMPGSKKVGLKLQSNGNVRREIRSATNGATSNLNYFRPNHNWLRLVRSGSTFAGYTSTDGDNWSFAFTATIPMTGCVYAGLFAESVNANVTTTGVFDHVTVTGTIPSLITPGNSVTATATPAFEVYPNPTTGQVTMNLSTYLNRSVRLLLYDVQGKVLKTMEIDAVETNAEHLDLSTYEDGIYLIRMQSEGLPDATKRVVVNGARR